MHSSEQTLVSGESSPATPSLGPPVTGDPADVPAWAATYRASDFPPYGYAVDVVSFAIDHERSTLCGLVVDRVDEPYLGYDAWPGGFVDWWADKNAGAAALRERAEKTGIESAEYLETLDTYDENWRDPRQWAASLRGSGAVPSGAVPSGARVISKAFVALHRDWRWDYPRPRERSRAVRWTDIYQYLPWEDRRTEIARALVRQIVSALLPFDRPDDAWRDRVYSAFGLEGQNWNEERVSDRYQLLLEARLVEEAWRDRWGQLDPAAPQRDRALFGRALAFDHRLMLADGLGRLRGKIKYQPALLQALMPAEFPLVQLRRACEAIGGRLLARPNFIRIVTRAQSYRIVEPRLGHESGRPGPPAQLYGFPANTGHRRLDPSIRMPWDRLPRMRPMRPTES